jgi:hypothetical protein
MGLGRLLNICRSLEEESEVKRRSHEEKCPEISCCNLLLTDREHRGVLREFAKSAKWTCFQVMRLWKPMLSLRNSSIAMICRRQFKYLTSACEEKARYLILVQSSHIDVNTNTSDPGTCVVLTF